MALVGTELEPLHGFGMINRHTLSSAVRKPQREWCSFTTSFRRLSLPCQTFPGVFWQSVTETVGVANGDHRLCATHCRGIAQPALTLFLAESDSFPRQIQPG